MNANLLDLTPMQKVWGAFYAALHEEVQKLTALEATLASDSSAAGNQLTEANRRIDSTPTAGHKQEGGGEK